MTVSSGARRAYRFNAARALSAAGFALTAASQAQAVIVYDIPGSGQNTSPPPGDQGYQYVGKLNIGGATLVAPQVIITANHIGPSVGNIFIYNNINYSVDHVEQVGTSDIEIAHLAISTGHAGATIYTGTASAGTAVTVTGFGGPKGAALVNSAPSSGPISYGWAWGNVSNTLSWGNNTLSGIVTDGNGHGYAAFAFGPTAGSSAYTGGDSGSGMFTNVGGTYELMGVAYSIDGYWNNTQATTTDPNNPFDVPAPAYVESVYDLSGANQNASAANTLYTIYTNSATKTNFYGAATSANPQQNYASLIDNDPNFTINGESYAQYLNQRIAALSGVVSSTWTATSGAGTWSVSTNWSNGLPMNPGSMISFTGAGTLSTVTLDSDKEAGTLSFSGSVGYTLNGNVTLVMDNTGGIGNATITSSSTAIQNINSRFEFIAATNISLTTGASINLSALIFGSGSLNLSGSGVLTLSNATGNSYTGTNISGSTLIVSNTSGSATGTANVVMTGGTLGGSGIITGTVNASSGTESIFPSATLSSNSTTRLTLGGLTTGSGVTLQFNLVTPTNALNHTISSSDTLAIGANNLILNGGIVNLANHATGAASLGYYKVISYTGTIGGTGLSSLTLPATVNNVAYTFDTTHDSGFIDIHRGYLGDVDDSGFVDINDLAILAANWQQAGGWSQGNFLGDPTVDINDLAVLAANWQTGISSFGETADSLGGTSESFQQAVASVIFGASTVPEPTSLALLGLGAASLLSRRRRR